MLRKPTAVDVRPPTLDDWLDKVDYTYLNSNKYVPSNFALEFINFVKLVNGKEGESSKTPPMHLKMLDSLVSKNDSIVNLCFRGASKTSLLVEYLSLYLGVFGEIPGFGKVQGMIYITDSVDNGVKSARKNIEFRYNNSQFLKKWIPLIKFTDQYIEMTSKDGNMFGLKLYGAKSGIRGTKIFGKRPTIAVLDDLVSDNDARSTTVLSAIKDTIYRGVNHALDPRKRKVIMSGTPFNTEDPMIQAVESGEWEVNVYPVCETFPCDEEDFKPAWGDRFTYAHVSRQYNLAKGVGQVDGFYQELMLRISTKDNRTIEDHDIRWFSRDVLLSNISHYNFYITTDFATSTKSGADYSVISVWAYNSDGIWFWVDGVCARQLMDKTINDLFRLVQEYKPQSVGIEISGQQGGFIQWIQGEMLNRNTWFSLACTPSTSQAGIRPVGDKLSRFNMVVPWFKTGKIHFPIEWKTSSIMGVFMNQLRLVTTTGIKGKDDCIDTISMLAVMPAWKPYYEAPPATESGVYGSRDSFQSNDTPLRSYVV